MLSECISFGKIIIIMGRSLKIEAHGLILVERSLKII
jgi:hypothetical protein